MYRVLFTIILCCTGIFGDVLKKPSNLPCKQNDVKCITDAAQWMYKSVLPGNLEKGMQNLDPMHLDKVRAALGYLNYTLENVNIEHFKTCKVSNASVDLKCNTMHLYLICQRIHIDGYYDINGELLTYPIRGNGDFYADCVNYHITIDTKMKFHNKGTNLHAKFESFTIKADLLGTLDLEMKNLFDGNKELAANIYRLVKESPRLLTSVAHTPFFKASVKTIMNNFNKFLEETPITEVIEIK